MGAAVKANGAQIIGAVMAAGFAIATKGLLELESITADFRAETGASADEADRAGKAINRMAGRNIQPLREVGAALTKVHTDMGLAGDEAETLTERFLKFGRATKQDAAAAVSAFDNILDAWGLTAADSQQLMDKLVVSNQTYGGVISKNEAILADLAPALKAANLSIDDGIGLLNLFNSAGVDASTAAAAFTKALSTVKSPEELQRLIDQITATEDPFKRAQLAADLFGAKAGPKLANVLKPGIGGIDDFKISTEEASGATEEAARVLDSTWGARFQLMIKGAGAALIDFGSNFGPALSGIAALASLAGPTILKPLAAALLEAGKKGGAALGEGLQSVWEGAGGTVIGNNIASRVENILDPTKSTVIGNAYRKVAGKAATVYLTALFAGDAIGAALKGVWVKLTATSVGQAIIAGTASGTAFATAASAAILAAPAIVLAVTVKLVYDYIEAQANNVDLINQISKDAGTASIEALKQMRERIATALAQEQGRFDPIEDFFGLSQQNNLERQLEAIDSMIAGFGGNVETSLADTAGAVTGSLNDVATSTKSLATDSNRSWELFVGGATSMRERLAFNADRIKAAIHDLTATLLGEAQALIDGYYDPIIAQDELRVQKDQVTADTIARNATKAGTAERHQADLTLANSKKTLDQTRANLLAAGTLSAKEQKTWLAELEKRYKTATGNAKTEIGLLIAKIKELQRVPTTVVEIIASITSRRIPPRAHGGPVTAGQPYYVNENTPRSEVWIPEVSGRVSSSAVPATSSPTGGDTINNINVQVEGTLRARTPFELTDTLRRAADFGVLTPRRRAFADE